ncbi:MAG: septal ring lytic transglycosylase RlpA family protein [Geitlerinemataceae cyanobacterium]
MNQKIWNRLSATVLATGLGLVPSGLVATASPISREIAEPDWISQQTGDPQKTAIQLPAESDIAQTEAHEFDGRPAATLYVRNIPILTFLGSATDSPESRATAIAARLNRLARSGVDANTIAASWIAEGDRYVIQVGRETLVELDADTILPDITANPADDALQATNRLRRVMGNAAPLDEIAGKPIEEVRSALRPKVLPKEQPEPVLFEMEGWASWYGPGFNGNLSASGEVFDQYALTAAHRDLPFDTLVRVTNLDNGQSVVVRINDRGPFIPGREIDLSAGAAEEIGMMASGTAPVAIEVLGSPESMAPASAFPQK